MPAGLKYYYYRKGKFEIIEKDLKADKMKLEKPNFYYYDYSFKLIDEGRLSDINEEVLEKNFFCDAIGSYLLYLKGKVDKAKEIANCVLKRLKLTYKEGSLLSVGALEFILKRMILKIVLGLELDPKEREIIEKAKENFPFYFKIYKLNLYP